jgi:predicted SPOUT superfamily RNA methylase MTH1
MRQRVKVAIIAQHPLFAPTFHRHPVLHSKTHNYNAASCCARLRNQNAITMESKTFLYIRAGITIHVTPPKIFIITSIITCQEQLHVQLPVQRGDIITCRTS